MKDPDAPEQEGPRRRAGRRPAAEAVDRGQVMLAAQARFARQGYEATTLREVAEDVGVNPSLVHYLFGSKDELFTASVAALAVSPAAIDDLAATGTDGLGQRIVRTFLAIWDDPAAAPLLALVRSATTHPRAAALLSDYLDEQVVDRLARVLGGPEARLRASLVNAHLTGLLFSRHILRLAPLATAEPDDLARLMGAALDHYVSAEPTASA